MANFWSNRWQIWTNGLSGRGRMPRAHRQAPPGPTRASPDPTYGPTTLVIHGSTSSANEKPPFKSVWSRAKINSWWIDGPIVIHLGASTNLPTDFLSKSLHVLSSQPPWRSNQHPWMQRRCIQGPASTPMPPPGAPQWPLTSLLPTNTLHASLHYK